MLSAMFPMECSDLLLESVLAVVAVSCLRNVREYVNSWCAAAALELANARVLHNVDSPIHGFV